MKKLGLILLLAMIMVCLNAPLCQANSAEPPSILIIVPNAPSDLEIRIEPDNIKAGRIDKVIESYFTFYRHDLNSFDNTLKVTTGGRTFEIILDTPLKSYNNIFTLDLKNQTLIPGKTLSRSATLISIRVILTLIIEAIVFFLFGYRTKRSWLIFLIVNLITQGVLNFLLSGNYSPLNGYMIFSLIVGEILVFIIEIVAFLLLIKEHRRLRTALYVIAANLLSLVAGGYLITVLPV